MGECERVGLWGLGKLVGDDNKTDDHWAEGLIPCGQPRRKSLWWQIGSHALALCRKISPDPTLIILYHGRAFLAGKRLLKFRHTGDDAVHPVFRDSVGVR